MRSVRRLSVSDGMLRTAVQESGCAVVERVLTFGEVSRLIEALETHPRSHRGAGGRHALQHPQVDSIANNPTVLDIAEQVLGSRCKPFRATLFEKSSQANWL